MIKMLNIMQNVLRYRRPFLLNSGETSSSLYYSENTVIKSSKTS